MYDSRVLVPHSVEATGLSSGFLIMSNLSIRDTVKIAMVNPTGLSSGQGSLVNLVFSVVPDVERESLLALSRFVLADQTGKEIPSVVRNSLAKVILGITGDINGDQIVNSADAILCLRFAALIQAPTEQERKAADFNKDGQINSADAILILQIAAGLPDFVEPAIAASTGFSLLTLIVEDPIIRH